MHFSLIYIVCDSSYFLICALLSLIVVHYARDCSCNTLLSFELPCLAGETLLPLLNIILKIRPAQLGCFSSSVG